MGYEIDFLPVGEGEKSGDAIALRFGDLRGSDRNRQRVIVIDGGFEASGKQLVEHINRYYDTNYVDLVVSTHPDADHVGGLKVVLDEMRVGKLWMHRPWHRNGISNGALYAGQTVSQSMRDSLRRSLKQAHELDEIARSKRIPVEHPFCGHEDATGSLMVLGPTEAFYAELLSEFRESKAISARRNPTFTTLLKEGRETIKRVFEHWGVETLTDSGETSAENESSVVLLLSVEGHRLLFTADAGQRALARVVGLLNHASGNGTATLSPDFVQVPHHGSRRNVSPELLDRLVGPKQHSGAPRRCTAFVSASEDGEPKHPAKKVTNAFLRRGAPVHSTQGASIRHQYDAPARQSWEPIEPHPFYSEVEDAAA